LHEWDVDVAFGCNIFVDDFALFINEIKIQFVCGIRRLSVGIRVFAAIAFEVAVIVRRVHSLDERVAPFAVIIDLLRGQGKLMRNSSSDESSICTASRTHLLAGWNADGVEFVVVSCGEGGASDLGWKSSSVRTFFFLTACLSVGGFCASAGAVLGAFGAAVVVDGTGADSSFFAGV